MILPTGSRLGPYEILAALGAGGMGEVYRAKDTRLDRDVAIKILPTHLAADPAARARFEREAKAVAALSHPNILAIHDFGVDHATGYVVTELLEGETLRDRIKGGPLGARKAVQIARDIAQGLAAAHDKGIVHRDIKPENVFVTSAGHVKILDFGLARQAATPADPSSAMTMQATDPGTVMGTVGYMSPEQVRGETADPRSDLFSLGCVLFELVSGKRAFERGTTAETMTAILREDPPDLTRADATVPPALEQIVRHCLEKQPAERFQSARDLAFALQSVSAGSTSSGPAHAVPARASSRASWPIPVAVGMLVVGVVAGRYVWTSAQPASASQPISFERMSDGHGIQTEPSLSPDGKSVVYAQATDGVSHLYVLRVGARSPVALQPHSAADDSEPAFSPEGERIAFRSDRDGGGVFVMSSTGESVKRVTDAGFNPSWSPDGKELVLATGRFTSPADLGTLNLGLFAVNVDTGAKRQLMPDTSALQPNWSPHGKRIAFWGLRGDTGQRDIWTIAADGSELTSGPVTVTNDVALDWSPAWSPDGAYLYFSSQRGGTMNLWRIAIDESSGKPRGAPESVTAPSNWNGFITFSRDGSRMAFASVNWRSTLMKVALDPARDALAGVPMPLLRNAQAIRDHELSPDQQWIAFMETGAQENIVVARADGSEYRRLTEDAFRNRGPIWSPDGKQIGFYSDRGGAYDIWTIRPDGSGLAKITNRGHLNFPTWSADGAHFAMSSSQGKSPWWQIVEAKEGAVSPAESLPQVDDKTYFRPMSWSPDGRRIAGSWVALDSTSSGVAVYDLTTRRFQTVQAPSAVAGSEAWLADSQRFVLRDTRGIWLVDPAKQTRKLLISVGGYMIGRSVSVSRDGRSITYTETGTEGEIWLAKMK